jgi:2Fe-2S ferredoxin
MINFEIQNREGQVQSIEVPEGISLSLMEVLKASDYDIAATCGGMALCATCLVKVLRGRENLPQPTDAEMDMLDVLPDFDEGNRLSCQIPVSARLEGSLFSLPVVS